MLDFKFIRHLPGPGGGDVGHGYQASLGYQATEILRVAPAHFPNSKYTDSQLTHAGFSPKVFAHSLRGHQQHARHPGHTATVELPSYDSRPRFTAEAARNISPASCPRHEPCGLSERTPIQRPQRSA